ncbi:MAG: serine/threonine protein kinase [Myxococcales bacterium]|nr:serine/threonine protein kinase [Myxococcales bacterium]
MTSGQGERWGNYLLEERIAAGGMAEVFRARRIGAVGFSKLVCIKRMHRHLSDDAEFVGLFLDEGRTGAKLRHRNVIAVDDLGEHNGQYFIAMEYIHGVDLAQLESRLLSSSEPFPPSAAVYIAMEVLSALGAAHRAIDPDDGVALQIVHRDVAPHNILVSYSGEVKLGDFGIARAARRAQVTSGNVVRGRFGYMPLEQLSGNAIDNRADLYALGVVLYEMLAGQRPFLGATREATVESIVAAQVVDQKRPIAELRAGLSEELCLVVDTLLAKDPEERFSSAEAALAVLERARERSGGAQALAALLARLYPTQSSVATASAPAIAVTPTNSSQKEISSISSVPNEPTRTSASPVADASQRRGAVLQVVADGSDPLAKPFDTDPRTTPPTTIASTTEPRAEARQRGVRWPVALLAGSLSVASLVAVGLVTYSRSQGAALNREVTSEPRDVPDARSEAVDAQASPIATERADSGVEGEEDSASTGRTTPRLNTIPRNQNNAPSSRDAAVAARTSAPDAATQSAANAQPNGRGVLRVVVTPFGQVSIDNGPLSEEFNGTRDFPVSAGPHRVRVTGAVEVTQNVTIVPGETRTLRFHGE